MADIECPLDTLHGTYDILYVRLKCWIPTHKREGFELDMANTGFYVTNFHDYCRNLSIQLTDIRG